MNIKTNQTMPYLTGEIPGVGGKIKTHWDDFLVEELPLYEPSGVGDHLYIQIEKRGRATLDAIAQIAGALKISRGKIGYAGLKDTWAVTKQWLSIEHIKPEQLECLDIPRLKILQTARHTNKLRIGHLAGNRFTIRLREPQVPLPEAVRRTEEIMDQLAGRGVGNYFGPQRFGQRGESHLLGRAIVHDDIDGFFDIFLGGPLPIDSEAVSAARMCYDNGELKQAYCLWPRHFHEHQRVLRALLGGKTKAQALGFIDKRLKRLFVSAFQSELFNRVLAARMPDIDKLFQGDPAYIHESGACFCVEDVLREQPRCQAFEISPTGPIFGSHMLKASGYAGEMESSVLAKASLKPDFFDASAPYRLKGGRRSLRFQPRDTGVCCGTDDTGPFIELRFELDSGCYATCVIGEITKTDDL